MFVSVPLSYYVQNESSGNHTSLHPFSCIIDRRSILVDLSSMDLGYHTICASHKNDSRYSSARVHLMEDSAAYPSCQANSINSNMCSNVPPSLIVEQSSMSSTGSEEKESGVSPPRPPSTPTNQRRAIFDNFWKKSSSIRDDNDSVTDTPTRRSGCTKVEPSYLGIYSFAPPSPLTPKPGLVSAMSPSSDDSLTPSPTRPKSILRRHHSARLRMVHPIEEEAPAEGKSRRLSLCSSSEIRPRDPMLKLPFAELPFAPQLYEGDTDSTSKDSSSMRCHGVHFDPTITVREIIGQKKDQDPHSNWFNEDELQSFFRDAIHLCHASAINSIKVRTMYIFICKNVIIFMTCLRCCTTSYPTQRPSRLQKLPRPTPKQSKSVSRIQSSVLLYPRLVLYSQSQYFT